MGQNIPPEGLTSVPPSSPGASHVGGHSLFLEAEPVVCRSPNHGGRELLLQGQGLQGLGQALNSLPDFMAGLVKAVLGCILVDPDVSGEWAQGGGALGHQGRGRREPISTGHPPPVFPEAPLSTQGSQTGRPSTTALHSPEREMRVGQKQFSSVWLSLQQGDSVQRPPI